MIFGGNLSGLASLSNLITLSLIAALLSFLLILLTLILIYFKGITKPRCFAIISQTGILLSSLVILISIRSEPINLDESLTHYSAKVSFSFGDNLNEVLGHSKELVTYIRKGDLEISKEEVKVLERNKRDYKDYYDRASWSKWIYSSSNVELTLKVNDAQATVSSLLSLRASPIDGKISELTATFPGSQKVSDHKKYFLIFKEFLSELGWIVPEDSLNNWDNILHRAGIPAKVKIGSSHPQFYTGMNGELFARIQISYHHEGSRGFVKLIIQNEKAKNR